MKNLILIRHAKSSWDNPIDDFNRELLSKGVINSIKIANLSLDFLKNRPCIWSSSAKRASETAKIFVENWKMDVKSIEFKKDLYTFNSSQLEINVKSCSNDYDNLILFGHNSAITDFVNKFGDIFIENVPTSGFVSINFDVDSWKNINKGKINKILFPRDL